MERLTEWDQDGNGVCGSQYRCESSCHECSHHDKMIDRLAAYEDTGLTPEEIRKLRKKYEEPGQKCNRGHVNNLPLRLWTCPVCAEELAVDRAHYKRAFEEVCRQFNYGDEKDYEDMRDEFLRMVGKPEDEEDKNDERTADTV